MTAADKFQGIAVSPGFAIGQAHLVTRGMPEVPHYCVTPEHLDEECRRFFDAVALSRAQLVAVRDLLEKEQVNQELLYIFDAHRLILDDTTLRDRITAIIRERVNAERAVSRYLHEIIAVFQRMHEPYLREKKSDIEQVGIRILNNLLGTNAEPIFGFPHPVILVAEEFTPSDTLMMAHESVLGFVTQHGGRTSHTAILAKSIGIPAVVGAVSATHRIRQGEYLVLDGFSGWIHVNPDEKVVKHFINRQQQYQAFRERLLAAKVQPAQTRDGHRMLLKANIELDSDAHKARKWGADGIGLYRTEHLYMNRDEMPGEEDLVAAFRGVLRAAGGLPATIRTMDIGGEKQSDVLGRGRGSVVNPALGLQGIRLCLREERAAFTTQLRALLRASTEGGLRILFPMVSGLSELEEALELLEAVREELKRSGIPFDPKVPVGSMVEVPAAALCADQLAARVDFLSIGTNDLTQFTLAVDRLDEAVAYLYEPAHPAVLRLIRMTVQAAHERRIPVSLCGEMAGDPRFAVLFVGMDIDELSATPSCLPLIRRTVRGIDHDWAVEVAQAALGEDRCERVLAHLDRQMREAFGEDHVFH